jgi:uncharacterized membrane protein YvbJ
MSRSKKIFFIAFGIFVLVMIFLGYDISRRTTFPGSKSQLKERLKQKYSPEDSASIDTLYQKSQEN